MIGSHADIESARIADVRDFHQQFYTPNNASIAIAGDFDAKQLRALLDEVLRTDSRRAEGRSGDDGDARRSHRSDARQ